MFCVLGHWGFQLSYSLCFFFRCLTRLFSNVLLGFSGSPFVPIGSVVKFNWRLFGTSVNGVNANM